MDCAVLRVRMFGDWDNDSTSLIQRLRNQTPQMVENQYRNLEFVDDDSYDHAILFNYSNETLLTSPEKNIRLILEPPEYAGLMYRNHWHCEESNAAKVYSFAYDPPYLPAYGIGFSTVPVQHYPPIDSRPFQICMIVSSKTITEYHRIRQLVKDQLIVSDIDIHIYGRGIEGFDKRIKGEIPNGGKQFVLSQYKYCVDFENSSFNAVTDKYFDPIVCGTVPVTNSSILSTIAPNSFEFVSFEQDPATIAEQIGKIAKVNDFTKYDLTNAKNEFLYGKLNLAEWIYQRIEEL